MAINFADQLNTNIGDIERPPLLPTGTYRWMVEKVPSFDTIANGDFDVVDFQLRCLGNEDDVDEEALREFGNVTNARMRHRFLFNKNDEALFKRTLFNLKRFLNEHLRVDASEDAPLKEALNASVNMTCKGLIRWRPDKNDPEVQYAEIASTAADE